MRWLVVLVLAAACGSNLPKYNYAGEPDPRTSEVILGVGDVVAINVWGEGNKDLNTEATIRPDGTITMPLVGDLKASGRTPTELKKQITAKLADFVKTLQGSLSFLADFLARRECRQLLQQFPSGGGVDPLQHFHGAQPAQQTWRYSLRSRRIDRFEQLLNTTTHLHGSIVL